MANRARTIGDKEFAEITPAELCKMAASPDTSPDVLGRLAGHTSWHARAAVAANPALPPSRLKALAGDALWGVRYGAASSPNLDAETGTALAADLAPIRLRLAANPATPPEVIRSLLTDGATNGLATDDDVYVKGLALGHPACPIQYLRDAAKDLKHPAWVLAVIAANPTCPPELRDEIDTWLVLGGGNGDANFDPVTCNGHPDAGDSGFGDEHPVDTYRRFGEGRRADDPHPLFKARYHQGGEELTITDVEQLLLDPEPLVRTSVIGRRGSIRGGQLSGLIHDEPYEPLRMLVGSILIRETKAALAYNEQLTGQSGRHGRSKTPATVEKRWLAWLFAAMGVFVALTVLPRIGSRSPYSEIDFAALTTQPAGPPSGPRVTAPGGAALQISAHPDAVTGRLSIQAADAAVTVRSITYGFPDGRSRPAALTGDRLPISVAANDERHIFLFLRPEMTVTVELASGDVVETIAVPLPNTGQATE